MTSTQAMIISQVRNWARIGALLLAVLMCAACGGATEEAASAVAMVPPFTERAAVPGRPAEPTATSAPSPTPAPVTLWVAEDVWAQFGAELTAVLAAYPHRSEERRGGKECT